MRLRLRWVPVLVALALSVPALALAHPPSGGQDRTFPAAVPDIDDPGPCTDEAAASMPEGEGHDHLEIDQHRFACRMRQVSFDGLGEELGAQRDVVLGEMDVKNDLAAVTVTFPESGVLFFDVSDPAQPTFLSWYRGSKCEGLVTDINCGAFVDLSSDATTAFLSTQALTFLPGGVPDLSLRPVSLPSVEVIDVRQPRTPRLAQIYPVVSLGGVHTSRSHIVPTGSTQDGPRAPGEYVFSVANGLGLEISRLDRSVGGPRLTKVSRLSIDDVHDTFIQNDELTGRTYLYVAAGFESGAYVYDVTDPAQPQLLAEWDLTPQCSADWYAHTIDVVVRDGRRSLTLDAESLDLGPQPAAEQARGCGEVHGNGDKPGPLWIVDATDFSELGPAQDSGNDAVDDLRSASEAALVSTWTNPAGRPGGDLRFSAHNQQIVGDTIYLSHYHGGVYVLDASGAFAGRSERPRELGVVVPHGDEVRPATEPLIQPLIGFFGEIERDRPMIWDAVFHEGYVLAADMRGGLYSFRYEGDS
ncbi:MAG TPA: hypothetical protein VK975_05925 [Acidimicrobiales bacterium]|nr:hypothetical protein [Acidimicrobiales bacterium]